VGERRPVRLTGLGSAGYRWEPEIDGDEAVASVHAADVETPPSDAPGSSAEEAFTIHALRPGVTRVRFAQRRPWDSSDSPPAHEHIVDLHVTSAHSATSRSA